MVNTRQAQNELNALKDYVIGVFKNRNSNVFELVTEVNDDTINVIRITQFGIIQKEFNLPVHYGVLHLFPDNKNMNEMLNNPFEWAEFIEKFN